MKNEETIIIGEEITLKGISIIIINSN